MTLCPYCKNLFSTDNLATFEAITRLYTDDVSKERAGGYYNAVLSKPKVGSWSNNINEEAKEQYFSDTDSGNEYVLKILVITSSEHTYSDSDFSDYDVLITVGIFPYMARALEVNPNLKVFCTNALSDCQAFTKMLLMTFASDSIVDIDFFDIESLFSTSAEKTKLVQHLSYEEAKGKDEPINYALAYAYNFEIDLFQLSDIFEKYNSLSVPDMRFLGCSGNRAVGEEEGVFVAK